MSTNAGTTSAVPRVINPWIIALAVVVPTFMEVLDTTIANVALRYIAGGLSAAVTDSEWVITSYLAANATVLPISGWLSTRFGRRNYFLGSIALFTIASALCGMATSLEELILFRILQGLAGGGLQPSSQAILLDTFPRERQSAAMTMFGVAALLAPVVGPTLGGYLTVNYEWRWIFYINIPIGLLALGMGMLVLRDPDYLIQAREEMKREKGHFDGIGLSVLILAISSWEILLSKGQEWDWFGDTRWRIHVLVACFVFGLIFLIWHELRSPNPIINFRPLRERNFASACIICFCAYGVLYGASTTLPNLLQTQFGYDALASGLVISPSGLFAIISMLIVGSILGRGADARWFVFVGLIIMAAGCYWMVLFNLDVGPWQLIWPRIVLIIGLSTLFAPLNVAAYMYTPRELRASAVGLFALLRNEGGSVGTSMAQTMEIRREQFHVSRVGEFLDPLNPTVSTFLSETQKIFQQIVGDPVLAHQMALQSLENLRQQQAASLSFFDDFYLFAVIGICLTPLVLLMKRSVPEQGAHVAAE